MSDHGGIHAGKDALDGVTKGINAAIGELKELGTAGSAAVGRGFEDLALSGMETGHDGLTAAFKTFCERWEWGVRALVHDGSQFAERVGLAAGYYHEGDQYVKDTVKVVANAAFGNPHLTEEQVEGMRMKDVLADNPFTQVRDADYSKKSFAKAAEDAEETWSRTAKDVGKAPNAAGLAVRLGSKIEDYS
ncbi:MULTISPECIES: hypothetical protein [Streptomyces]|uniref:Uncharacterized protein n=1 Tax=Streptomyces griseocarneus TaxID=51201 RepID=A0ABX7RWX7_9ACTN|nr:MULTISPECIES: hypothetical protein [Streptomyces]QSY51416.1 hypothetical protein J3S04_11415 [Streptomyces griseocarneus]